MEVGGDGESEADEDEECGDGVDDKDGGEAVAGGGGELEVAGVVAGEEAICAGISMTAISICSSRYLVPLL